MTFVWVEDCKLTLWKLRTGLFFNSYYVGSNLQAASRFVSITCCYTIRRGFSTCMDVVVDGLQKEITTLPGTKRFTSLWGVSSGSWRRIHVICQVFAWATTNSPAGSFIGGMVISYSKGTWDLINTSHQLLPLVCHALKKICGNSTCPSYSTVSKQKH